MRRLMWVVSPAAICGLLFATAPQAVAQLPAPPVDTGPAPATIALVETWADGRVSYELTSTRRGSMWTPNVPRVEGYRLPAGATPVYAVQIVRWQVDAGIHVDVSVLLGTPEPPGVLVFTGEVGKGERVVVDGLTEFGIKPVALSMADVAPLSPYLPTATSASPLVEIADIQILTAPYPGYRVTLRNLGTEPVASVRVQTYRGPKKSLSSLQRDPTGRPMLTPGGSFTFNINLTSGPADAQTMSGTWSPAPLDVIDLEEVRWVDATSDGSIAFPGIHERVARDSGRRLQVKRVLSLLEATLDSGGADMFTTIRKGVERLPASEADQLPEAQIGMQMVKRSIEGDIARFERDRPSATATEEREWLELLLRRYETQLTRLSPP